MIHPPRWTQTQTQTQTATLLAEDPFDLIDASILQAADKNPPFLYNLGTEV